MSGLAASGAAAIRAIIFCTLACLALAGVATAQTAEGESVAAEAEAQAAAENAAEAAKKDGKPKLTDPKTKAKLDRDPRFSVPPPTLDASTHDLLLLNSGEWLQGDIRSIRDDDIDFDSVELEDLTIDFGDVKEIHADRMHTYRFEGKRDILTGPVRMNQDVFVIGDQERPRSAFMTQVSGKPTELNFWNGDLSVGYSIRSGNTNQSDLTVRAELNRETALTRFTNVYNAALSTAEVDDGTGTGNTTEQKTANSHRLNSAFDYFVTGRLYLIIPAFEVFADEFQNIDLRITPSAGLGYEVISNKWMTWDVSAQGGATYTDSVSVQAGEPESTTEGVVVLGTTLDTDPTDDIEWDTSYTVQVVPANIGLTNHHLESIFSIDLFFNFDLDITFIWDRIEDPKEDADGNTPESNDYRLTFGIGWDF